jgi:flagellar basal body P-ring formation protein FlgA
MNQSAPSIFRHAFPGRAAARAVYMAWLACFASGMAEANPGQVSVLEVAPPTEPATGSAPGAASTSAAAAPATAAAQGPTIEPASRVRAAAEAVLNQQLQNVAYRVYVHATGPDTRLHLAHCPAPLAASLSGSSEPSARMLVRVSCNAPGVTWAVFVPVAVESDVGVLVLRQSALRGARLSGAEVSVETRRVPGIAVGYVTDLNALPRFTLLRSLPAGTVLTGDVLQADYLVRSGQQVTLVAASPGINVRATGRALEDGREGAHVRVQNLASLKVVQGVVGSDGVIEVTP